jgi:LPXTG-site transpeptidase (sortase) family protein
VPNRLEIPDLGIDVTGRPVGLDDQGRMGLFDDPSIAAWYQWGPAPESPAGSTVIAAHVDSLEYDLLPFARLKDAVAGTQVVVTDAAGTRHPYAVQSVQVVEKADVDWNAAFDRAGPPRLTLVTCGGEFDDENRRYLSNLVLTATPAG